MVVEQREREGEQSDAVDGEMAEPEDDGDAVARDAVDDPDFPGWPARFQRRLEHVAHESAQLLAPAGWRQRGCAQMTVGVEARIVDPRRAPHSERRRDHHLPQPWHVRERSPAVPAQVGHPHSPPGVAQRPRLEQAQRADLQPRVVGLGAPQRRVLRPEPLVGHHSSMHSPRRRRVVPKVTTPDTSSLAERASHPTQRA